MPVCAENPIRVDDVMESPLMSVVNGRAADSSLPGGDPHSDLLPDQKCAQGRR